MTDTRFIGRKIPANSLFLFFCNNKFFTTFNKSCLNLGIYLNIYFGKNTFHFPILNHLQVKLLVIMLYFLEQHKIRISLMVEFSFQDKIMFSEISLLKSTLHTFFNIPSKMCWWSEYRIHWPSRASKAGNSAKLNSSINPTAITNYHDNIFPGVIY